MNKEQPQLPEAPSNFQGKFRRLQAIRTPDGKQTTVDAFSDDREQWFFIRDGRWVPIIEKKENTE